MDGKAAALVVSAAAVVDCEDVSSSLLPQAMTRMSSAATARRSARRRMPSGMLRLTGTGAIIRAWVALGKGRRGKRGYRFHRQTRSYIWYDEPQGARSVDGQPADRRLRFRGGRALDLEGDAPDAASGEPNLLCGQRPCALRREVDS